MQTIENNGAAGDLDFTYFKSNYTVQNADYVIGMGPDGNIQDGQIVAAGTETEMDLFIFD